MALYLKYRPQTLDELVGQEKVKTLLSQSFLNNKLSHAYLFIGPKGTGKTSTARILAKMVNCELTPPLQVPCNKCNSCVSITNGSCLDLIEIDAASNRGIDDVRTLRENIKLSPVSSKKKVYIIDEVHMLTTEAFNALLKTLEEPPAHALFIMATTEPHKIPETILSRATRVDFKQASVEDAMEALKKVAKSEGLKVDDEALRVLADKADGSFRDGIKILDSLSALDKSITVKDIEEQLKSTNFESLIKFLSLVGEKKTKEALFDVQRGTEGGINVKEFTLSLMEALRHSMLIQNDLGELLVKERVGSDKYVKLQQLSAKFSLDSLVKALDSLQRSLERLKTASIPHLPLELAVVEMCRLESQQKSSSVETPISRPIDVSEGKASPAHILKANAAIADNPEITKLQEKWQYILETIRPYNYSLEALLRSVKIMDVNGGIVMLEVPYSFHQRILETPRNRDTLESVLADVLGGAVKVSIVLGERPQRIEDIANVEVAAEDEVLKLASEIFNGKLVD